MVHDPLRPQPDDPGQDPDSDETGEGALTEEAGGERIAKLLARSGVGSRRDVERLIGEGRVAINGRTLTTPAVKAEPGDILTVDGEVVGEPEPARLFRYHKPVGLLTTHKDPAGRRTIFGQLPDGLPRLISIGRLDINSEGLLLLTNDGGLARALEQPSNAIVRRYRARAHGRTTQERLDTLKTGITVEGVRYGPIEATLDKVKDGPQGANLWLTITLHEGKNREVRRVLEALGLKVNRLIRLAYGPLALGTLGDGELEEVGPRVVREQFAEYIEAENLPTGERPKYRSPRKSASRRAQDEAKTATELAPVRTPKEKPEYKAGWAKPKRKLNPHLQAKAKRDPATRTPDRPDIVAGPKASRPKPARQVVAGSKGPPGAKRPSARRPEAQRSDAQRPEAHRPETARAEASRPETPHAKPARTKPAGSKAPVSAQRPGAKRTESQRPDARRPKAERPEARRTESERPETPHTTPGRPKALGSKSSGSKSPAGAQRPGAKRPEAQRPDVRRSEAQRPEGKRPEGKRPEPRRAEAKRPEAKAPGSTRVGGPGSGPRGPKPSASPRGTTGAHRPGPPRSGGRGPRG